MRDQVIPQKVGNRTGIGKSRSGVGQRPAKRSSSESIVARLRSLLGYVPTALRIAAIAIVCLLVLVVYRAAASASFFQIKKVETKGASRASVDDIQTAVRHEVAETGVWRADLVEISKHLERLPWVRSAIVTRVLPDGIRVRISERQPRAVVRTTAGRFIWVDDDAVYLGEMAPTDQLPGFFLRGWNEDEGGQVENRQRIVKFLELQRDWERQGLSERVSEVNLQDLRDVRVQLGGDDSRIEIRLGSQEQGARLQKALTVLDAHRQTARGPLISYIDLSQGKRAIVGLTTGKNTVADGTDPASSSAQTPAQSSEERAAQTPEGREPRSNPRCPSPRSTQSVSTLGPAKLRVLPASQAKAGCLKLSVSVKRMRAACARVSSSIPMRRLMRSRRPSKKR